VSNGILIAGLFLAGALAVQKEAEVLPQPLDYCLQFGEKLTAQLPAVPPKIFHAVLPRGNYFFDLDTGIYLHTYEAPTKDVDVTINGFFQSGGLLPATNIRAENDDVRLAQAAADFSDRAETDVSSLSYSDSLFANPARGFVVVRQQGRYFALGEIVQRPSGIAFDYALLRECR